MAREGGERVCIVLDEDFVACVDKGAESQRGYSYTAHVVFDFLGNADDHSLFLLAYLWPCCNDRLRKAGGDGSG
jgi:hypothetical protein